MQINFAESNYLGYALKQEQESKGNDNRASLVAASDAAVDQFNKSDSSRNNESGLRIMDRIEISAEARALQQVLAGQEYNAQNQQDSLGQEPKKEQSVLHEVAAGTGDAAERAKDDKRLAFSQGTAAEGAGEESGDDKLRQLKEQLREAMQKLTEAQQKLAQLQAEAKQTAKEPGLGDLGNSAEIKAAQTEVTAANSEVMQIQEQLQGILREQSQSSGGSGGNINVTAGRTWSPQGATDMNVSDNAHIG